MLEYNTNIPLFPLNVVLFPGMMLPLHIFEERYKIMIRECLADGSPFGVVLAKQTEQQIEEGETVSKEFYRIGTTARITAVEHLKDGRMNLITVGQDRFVVKEFHPSLNNFFIGQVDPFQLHEGQDEKRVLQLTEALRVIVERYIGHLADASGEDLSGATIPTEPKALAFLAGTAIQGPTWAHQSDKQQLLSSTSLSSLIGKTIRVLDKEDKILSYMLKAYQAHKQVDRLPFVDYSLN
ncbi:LON peptidase substrate-binding domain-containing protein [Anaerolineales bacterium HSG25]|nr:LON peptidase substrate-binding domain-containing protein [Anaerolineales bacterium HSG25]